MLPSTPLGVVGHPAGAPVLTTGQNDDGSNHGCESIPPSTWNGAIWIGTCVVPLAFSELPLAVKRSGTPLMRVRAPLSPQLPKIQLPGPELSQCLLCPNGNSYTKLCTNVRSRF